MLHTFGVLPNLIVMVGLICGVHMSLWCFQDVALRLSFVLYFLLFQQVSSGTTSTFYVNSTSPNFLMVYFCCICSSADWRYAAEQFVKRLPDKIVVHCKFSSGNNQFQIAAHDRQLLICEDASYRVQTTRVGMFTISLSPFSPSSVGWIL